MIAISVKQPWASLIVHGIKNIENRTWVCPQRYIGKRVLIHASKERDKREKPLLTDKQYELAGDVSGYGTHIFGDRGAIIGSVKIVSCVQNHPSVWAEKGVFNWVLSDPILFDTPIPAKGKLGFWSFPNITRKENDMRVTATLNEKDHLCNYCGHEPATCPKASHLKFGTGVGNDNVIECSEYVPMSWDNTYPVEGKPELGVFPKGEVSNNK